MVESKKSRNLLGKRLGKLVAAERLRRGWTQEQLAERVALDAESISRFERGVTLPSLVTLERIAKALRVRVADLLTNASTQPSDQAVQIAALLDSLGERDRTFVVDQIRSLCSQLKKNIIKN